MKFPNCVKVAQLDGHPKIMNFNQRLNEIETRARRRRPERCPQCKAAYSPFIDFRSEMGDFRPVCGRCGADRPLPDGAPVKQYADISDE